MGLSFSDEHGAVLIADSTGRIVEDLQPMTSLYLSCVAEQNGKREQNAYGVAGRAGLDYYSRLVDALLERDILPWVTLFHWDHPQSLEASGGWANRATALKFVD